jgi:hypothetical protein
MADKVLTAIVFHGLIQRADQAGANLHASKAGTDAASRVAARQRQELYADAVAIAQALEDAVDAQNPIDLGQAEAPPVTSQIAGS